MGRRMRASRWLCLLCLCIVATLAHAAVPPAPLCTADAVSLAPWARIARDYSGDLTPDEVMRLPPAQLQPATSARAFGYGDTWWLRVDLRNDAATSCKRWLLVGPARLRDVCLYVRHGSGWIEMRSGSDYPFRDWASPVRRPVLPLVLASHAVTTVLVHVVDRGGPVAFTPELWSSGQFRHSEVRQALSNGLLYGSMLVLVVASLVLSFIYRRPLLFFMALAAFFYTLYVIALENYAFIYLWPDSPRLNLWVRYLCINLTYAAAFRYFSGVLRVQRLGSFWSWLFAIAQCGFVALALVGGLVRDSTAVTSAMLGLDQICRLLLVVAAVLGLFRRTVHSWYPPVLIGLFLAQDILLYGHVLGGMKPVSAANQMYGATVLGGGALLLGVLINQVRKGHRRELRARDELDRQSASERERLERTVTLRTAELDRALQARRLLLARISHDLRAPLAGILDSVRQWQAGATRRDYPHLIERHARQQMELIDELLEFSREELSELELQPVPGYLHAFLDEVAEQAELQAEHNGNRFVREFAPGLPALVRADFRRLRQVLANLLGNAAKFTRDGRIRFQVACAAPVAQEQARLRFAVEDDGIGIAPDERERLLLPFTGAATRRATRAAGSVSPSWRGCWIAWTVAWTSVRRPAAAAVSVSNWSCRWRTRTNWSRHWTKAARWPSMAPVAWCWWWTTSRSSAR